MASFYIVRINSKKKKSVPATDYKRFLAEIEQGGIGKWDTNHQRTMHIGDYQAFIWGEDADTAVVHIYRVERIGTVDDRQQYWTQNMSYTKGTMESSVGHRDATFLSANHPYAKNMTWPELRAGLGYKEKYVPRGNSRVRDELMWRL
jgi:hypothetical protein